MSLRALRRTLARVGNRPTSLRMEAGGALQPSQPFSERHNGADSLGVSGASIPNLYSRSQGLPGGPVHPRSKAPLQDRGPRTARELSVEYLRKHYGRSVDRFWKRVTVLESGCWYWNGAKDRLGYGSVATKRGASGLHERTLAHRFAYALAHGFLPAGADLLHSCDNPSCVNPAHLRPGTQRENIDDMHARGRAWWQQEASR